TNGHRPRAGVEPWTTPPTRSECSQPCSSAKASTWAAEAPGSTRSVMASRTSSADLIRFHAVMALQNPSPAGRDDDRLHLTHAAPLQDRPRHRVAVRPQRLVGNPGGIDANQFADERRVLAAGGGPGHGGDRWRARGPVDRTWEVWAVFGLDV